MSRIKTPNDKLNVLFFSPLLKTLKNIKVKKAVYIKKNNNFFGHYKIHNVVDACSRNNIYSFEFKCEICTLKHEILAKN